MDEVRKEESFCVSTIMCVFCTCRIGKVVLLNKKTSLWKHLIRISGLCINTLCLLFISTASLLLLPVIHTLTQWYTHDMLMIHTMPVMHTHWQITNSRCSWSQMLPDLALWSDWYYFEAMTWIEVFPVPLQNADVCQVPERLWQSGVTKYTWAPRRREKS